MAPTPRKEAAAAAQAAVPTKGSINRQYGQSISDVEGFTTALAHLLQQGPSAQGAYQSAIQGQQGIDAAAQHALGATGTPYAAGSQAAAAGLGTSALSALNARGAAAGAYGATLPHVAAARGTLGVQSLETARNQALQQRSESYSQAFQQALQQARQNAEAMREFNVNTGLQRRQMSIQQRQFAAQQATSAAGLAEQQREFNITNAYRYAALGAQARADSGGGGIARALGLTSNEFMGQVGDAIQNLSGSPPDMARVPVYKTVNGNRQIVGYNFRPVGGSGSPSALDAGVGFGRAVQELINAGTDPRIAVYAASRIYQGAGNARPGSKPAGAWQSFVSWMAAHGNTRYRNIQRRANRSSTGPTNQRNPHPGR